MTQIIYVKCTDAVILASDRKESDTSDAGQDAQKYYMPTNKEFVLAMAGESTRIGMILGELQRNHYTAATIRDGLHRIIDETKVNDLDSMPSGLLLVRNGDNITFNNVWCSDHTKNIVEGNPPFKHYGDGSYLVDYLIRKFDLPNLSWRESCPYLIAIMDAVADRVDSIGGIRDYGIDLLVFTNGETLHRTIHNTDGIGEIGWTCNIKNWPGFQFPATKSVPEGQAGVGRMADSAAITVKTDYGNYSLNYQINGGQITSVKPKDDNTLLISLGAIDDGELTITLPRSLIDAMAGSHNDEFFVLCDGEEVSIRETVMEKDRIVTIPFVAGCKEIEIIGSETFGGHADSEHGGKAYDAKEIDRVARQRVAPIVIQTDKDTYAYDSDMIVTITNPYFVPTEQMSLSVTDDMGNVMYKSMIPVSEDELGIYQEIIRMAGREWIKSSGAFRINVEYQDKHVGTNVTMKQPEMSVKLDKQSYSWTAKVCITATVPGLLKNPNSTAKLSDVDGCRLEVSTSMGKLSGYDLVETEEGLGIFTGEVRLTGFSGHDVYGSNTESQVSGGTVGSGPIDGKIGCYREDTLTVTLATRAGRVSSSAAISWNLREIHWLKTAYPPSGVGTLQVIDPDMSLNPEENNEVEVRVWSDSDSAGMRLWLQETGPTTGIFNGDVQFTKGSSSGRSLEVSKGDCINAEYVDRTLPDPHPIRNKQEICCSGFIQKQTPPTKKVPAANAQTGKLPSTPVISIPAGTSVPGCEECDNCFIPSNITVRANQTIIWTNDDDMAHHIISGTVNEGHDGHFDSRLILSRSSFSHKFVRKGTYNYFCVVHPWQAGVVVVE